MASILTHVPPSPVVATSPISCHLIRHAVPSDSPCLPVKPLPTVKLLHMPLRRTTTLKPPLLSPPKKLAVRIIGLSGTRIRTHRSISTGIFLHKVFVGIDATKSQLLVFLSLLVVKSVGCAGGNNNSNCNSNNNNNNSISNSNNSSKCSSIAAKSSQS